MPSPRWTATDLADQHGRRIVITGGNSGIGLVAAQLLAGAGAQVIIAVRDQAKGERAAAEIGGDTRVRALDLADLNSVRAFAAETTEPIDVLINNAGVMAVPLGRTAQGFETQFGVNHLGHFALTNLLLPMITDRVVSVASGAHRRGHIDLSDLNWDRRRYQRWAAYGQSKLANLLFILELERRLTVAGSPVRALASHPGWAATNLQSHQRQSDDGPDDEAGQSDRRPESGPGRLADGLRGQPGPAGRQLCRPGRALGATRKPDAGRADGGGQRPQAGRGALDGLGAVDRGVLPALIGAPSGPRYCRGRTVRTRARWSRNSTMKLLRNDAVASLVTSPSSLKTSGE